MVPTCYFQKVKKLAGNLAKHTFIHKFIYFVHSACQHRNIKTETSDAAHDTISPFAVATTLWAFI